MNDERDRMLRQAFIATAIGITAALLMIAMVYATATPHHH